MLLGDFYIVDIQRNPQTGLISWFKICEPCNSQPGPAFWASRAEIIQLIADGYTVEPLPGQDQMPPKRQMLRAVQVDGQVYLRADERLVAGDWLNGFGEGHAR